MKIKFFCALILLVFCASFTSAQTASPCGGAQRTLSINWYQFNFDPCLTGNNPYETKLSTSTVANLVLDWHVVASHWVSPPAVVNGVMYAYQYDGKVAARSVADGSLLWQSSVAPTTYQFYIASPAVANSIVYVGDGAGVLWALKASDGSLLWKYVTNSQHSFAPTVADGVVYVTESYSSPSYTYALDATTGSLLWKYLTASTQGIQPAADGHRVYVGGDYHLDALDAKTGAEIWTTGAGIAAAASVYNGRVYVLDNLGAHLHCLNAATGQALWTAQLDSNATNIVAANNAVYAQDGSGAFWALDAYTGNFLWKVASSKTSPALGMAVANGVIYSTTFFSPTDGGFIALDGSTGATLWSYHTGYGGFLSGPAIVNGTLYASRSGDVYAFHLPSQ